MRKRIQSEFFYPAAATLVLSAVALTSGCGYLRQVRDDVPMVIAPAVETSQLLNPEAGKNQRAVAGLDGPAAANVSEGYTKTFEKKEAPSRAVETFVGLTGLSAQ